MSLLATLALPEKSVPCSVTERSFGKSLTSNELSMHVKNREKYSSLLNAFGPCICDSNKARAMIGYITVEDFQPGIVPESDNWFKPADFDDEASREGQADMLDGLGHCEHFYSFLKWPFHQC